MNFKSLNSSFLSHCIYYYKFHNFYELQIAKFKLSILLYLKTPLKLYLSTFVF